uniref:Bifunctional inhibitor/plant lipid transfer protein/seed storage helical domain-containing protein n=1 Tax=Aegilops tauschii subsp. strangulata TaxID=200361 RepID=A0A453J9A4_AEGTS
IAMAPSKLTLFLALSLVLVGTSHGCGSCGNTPSVPVPTPPIAVPPPAGPVPTPPIAVAGGGSGTCSINTLKLGACANVLNLLKLNLGVPASEQCCPLLSGLADLDAAVCLCTAIKANVLGIKLNVPVDLVLLLNQCGKTCPADFTCPS